MPLVPCARQEEEIVSLTAVLPRQDPQWCRVGVPASLGSKLQLCVGKTELGAEARSSKRFGGVPFGSHFSGMLRGDYLGLNLF